MKTLYFGILVTVVCELGQLALIQWAERLMIVERADLEVRG